MVLSRYVLLVRIRRWSALKLPAVLDEPGGQPVQQLGMRRRITRRAEVARGPHQTDPEVVLPDPVDDHAGRQGVAGSVNQRARVSRRSEVLAPSAASGSWVAMPRSPRERRARPRGPGLAAWPRCNKWLTGGFADGSVRK